MRRFLTVLLLAVVAALSLAAPAMAHTEMAQSTPVPGEAVDNTLQGVGLTFTKVVDRRLATVTVRGANGVDVSQGPLQGEGLELVQPVRGLTPGRYDVQWRAAAADGHILRGTFGFRVGNATPTDPLEEAQPERLSPVEQLRQHAKGNYDHDTKPAYAIAADEKRPGGPSKDTAAKAASSLNAAPAAADNADSTLLATLAAAAGVAMASGLFEAIRQRHL